MSLPSIFKTKHQGGSAHPMCGSMCSPSPSHPRTKAPLPHSWEEALSSNLPLPAGPMGEIYLCICW